MQAEAFEPDEPGALQVLQIEELVACLDNGTEPSVTLETARDVVEATVGIYESARRDGAKVSFPLNTQDNPLVAMIDEGMI